LAARKLSNGGNGGRWDDKKISNGNDLNDQSSSGLLSCRAAELLKKDYNGQN